VASNICRTLIGGRKTLSSAKEKLDEERRKLADEGGRIDTKRRKLVIEAEAVRTERAKLDSDKGAAQDAAVRPLRPYTLYPKP